MAKFCIHCGKPLEDGEVCNCQDNVTTNPNAQNSNNETTNPNTCNPESDINSVIAENSIASENNNSSRMKIKIRIAIHSQQLMKMQTVTPQILKQLSKLVKQMLFLKSLNSSFQNSQVSLNHQQVLQKNSQIRKILPTAS